MGDEALDFFSTCIKEFCFELGLEYSFSVLMKVIQRSMPATHISINLLEPKTSKIVHLMEFNLTEFSFQEAVQYHNWIPHLNKYKVEVGENSKVYLVGDIKKDPPFWQIVQTQDTFHRALLTMELYHDEHAIYFMGLRAPEAYSFQLHHARLLSYLKNPMAELVRALFQNAPEARANLLNTATESQSSQALLARCRCLSPVLRQVDEVASANVSVLIEGASGVGKELVAEALHEGSQRKGRPFVKVNCGAIPESLLEAELFGYERGAFTGAVAAHRGYFEQANGGTLYLDEVGELSSMAQVRLLRVLESREVQRIGSPRRLLLDFRLITATNKNLEDLVAAGSFRLDLWYRINSYTIRIPGLDHRKEDIPVLARYFCERCAGEIGMDWQPVIEPALMRELVLHEWPGNVRQLRNWMERAMVHTRAAKSSVLLPPREDELPQLEKRMGNTPLFVKEAQPPTLEELERLYVAWALNRCNGQVQGTGGASELLGLKPNTLRSRMAKLGVPFPRQSG